MSQPTLQLAELSGLPRAEKNARLRAFARSRFSPSNGELASISQVIDDLEQRYGMTSDDMRSALRNGTLSETEEVCHWLLALEVQRELRANAVHA